MVEVVTVSTSVVEVLRRTQQAAALVEPVPERLETQQESGLLSEVV